VIARRWRPKDFSQLVGQSHVSQTLLNALKNERLHHALLFTGPRGTGKTSSARILAKAIRCPEAENFVPCDSCKECEDIAHGRSLNVMEIDGASNNGVESIRELRESVGYMPSFGKYKVYIIDEVHMLSTSAFNALLKTLEEPPGHVIFIMATTEVQKIPNTILSRCQRFDFRRISIKLITEQLAMICKADGVQASDEAIWMIARQGDGSLRDSQSLLDQVITFSGKEIDSEKVVDVLGLTDRVLLAETLRALVDRDQGKILGVVSKMNTSGVDSKVFVKDLLEEIRNLIMVKVCGDKSAATVDLPVSEIKNLANLSENFSQEDIHLLFDMALKGAADIARSESAHVVLEMLLLRMSQAPRIQNLMALTSGNVSGGTQSVRPPVSHKSEIKPSGTQTVKEKPSFIKKFEALKEAEKSKVSPAESTGVRSVPAESTGVKPQQTASTSYTGRPQQLDDSRRESAHVPTQKFQSQSSPTHKQSEVIELNPAVKSQSQLSDAPIQNMAKEIQPDTPNTTSSETSAKIDLSSAEGRWEDLVGKIKNINGLIGAQLENTYLKSVENKKVHIVVPGKVKFLFKRIGDADFQKKLLNYITTFWGAGYSLEVQMGNNEKKPTEVLTPKQSQEKQAEQKQDEVRTAVENHPMVKQANEHFKTEIQSIRDIKS
jgi:DNA polymerase-3 subunit gamma/tau